MLVIKISKFQIRESWMAGGTAEAWGRCVKKKKSQLCLEDCVRKSPLPPAGSSRPHFAGGRICLPCLSYLLDVRHYLWPAWWKDTVRFSPPPPPPAPIPSSIKANPGQRKDL